MYMTLLYLSVLLLVLLIFVTVYSILYDMWIPSTYVIGYGDTIIKKKSNLKQPLFSLICVNVRHGLLYILDNLCLAYSAFFWKSRYFCQFLVGLDF